MLHYPFWYQLVCRGQVLAKSIQSCLTLYNPIDGSPPGSPILGILQARTLEWVAISFSNAWKWKAKVKSFRHVWLFATPWTAAYQAPPSMGFSRQECWSGVPLPSPLPMKCQFLNFKYLSKFYTLNYSRNLCFKFQSVILTRYCNKIFFNSNLKTSFVFVGPKRDILLIEFATTSWIKTATSHCYHYNMYKMESNHNKAGKIQTRKSLF